MLVVVELLDSCFLCDLVFLLVLLLLALLLLALFLLCLVLALFLVVLVVGCVLVDFSFFRVFAVCYRISDLVSYFGFFCFNCSRCCFVRWPCAFPACCPWFFPAPLPFPFPIVFAFTFEVHSQVLQPFL